MQVRDLGDEIIVPNLGWIIEGTMLPGPARHIF